MYVNNKITLSTFAKISTVPLNAHNSYSRRCVVDKKLVFRRIRTQVLRTLFERLSCGDVLTHLAFGLEAL